MKEFQDYIQANLPERFKAMRMFRIPVSCNGVNYWAAFNNGTWDFKPASPEVSPIISYENTEMVENTEVDELSTEGYEEAEVKRPKAKVKEKPARPEKKSVREQKQRSVREQKPVREQKNVMESNFDMGDKPLSFVLNRPTYKLTGRFAIALITLILTLGANLIPSIYVMVQCSKANKNLDNPVEYWHYRGTTTYCHIMNILVLIFMIVSILIVIFFGATMLAILNTFGGIM